jgi:hypothetical protein
MDLARAPRRAARGRMVSVLLYIFETWNMLWRTRNSRPSCSGQHHYGRSEKKRSETLL